MSEFNEYARRLNAIAKAHFNAITEAQEGVRKAKEKVEANPYYQSAKTREALVKNAKSLAAQAELKEAEDALISAEKAFKESTREIDSLRDSLAETVNRRFLADPANLDANTLELLKSGILSPTEYRALIDSAIEADNSTLARIIGKYAKAAAGTLEEQIKQSTTDAGGRLSDEHRKNREILNSVIADSSSIDGSRYLEQFDSLAAVYTRTVNNGSMIKHWDSLTAETIENF